MVISFLPSLVWEDWGRLFLFTFSSCENQMANFGSPENFGSGFIAGFCMDFGKFLVGFGGSVRKVVVNVVKICLRRLMAVALCCARLL